MTYSEIIDRRVSEFYGITVADLHSSSRFRKHAWPRFVAMYLIRQHTKRSLTEIGRWFAGRDHTTVINGVNRIAEALETDETLKREIRALREGLTIEPRVTDRVSNTGVTAAFTAPVQLAQSASRGREPTGVFFSPIRQESTDASMPNDARSEFQPPSPQLRAGDPTREAAP